MANTIEFVLLSANTSPQPKRQIDRFSHFCTAHGRVSSGMPGHVLSPNNCPFAWGIWVPSNTCFFGPTRVRNLNGILIGSAVLHTAESGYTLQWAPLFPQNCPSHKGSGPSSNSWFPWSNRVSTQRNLDRFSRSAGLTSLTDR